MTTAKKSSVLFSSLEAAVQKWISVLGKDGVLNSKEDIATYSRSTSGRGTEPWAILLPKSTSEVAELVKIAAEFRIPLHPISKGKNWGYGDACAPTDGQVIVDLGRMNRILEVNAKLGYAVIEPGVTQGQLWNFLSENKTGLWMDATGAGPDTSLVGNIAERGFGHTRYGDHFQNSCGMEIVLADGRVLNTGFGHYEKARAQYVYRYGVGPVLDGLFSQSNFGIITRVGIWLMPEPEDFCAFFFLGAHEEDLKKIIDLLAPLKLQGTLQSAVHIANDLRVLSSRMRYPWHETKGIYPLPESTRLNLRKKNGLGAWNGCGSISGSKGVVRAIKKEIGLVLKDYRPIFINDKKLIIAEKLIAALPALKTFEPLKAKIQVLRPTFDMLKGQPVSHHLNGASWRVRAEKTGPTTDPTLEGAGLIWVSPILPMEGEQAALLTSLLTPVYQKHGFESLITFTLLTDRSLACVTNISFDRNIPEETERAVSCFHEICDLLKHHGFYSYRTGPLGFTGLTKHSTHFWDVVNTLKNAFDPHSIFSPGRYNPR